MKSSERELRREVQFVLDRMESAEVDIYDSYGDLMEAEERLRQALAAFEKTDIERLKAWLDEIEQTEHIGRFMYSLEGVEDGNERVDLVLIVIDEVKKYIADQFGVGEGDDAE